MDSSLFDYILPPERIAQCPAHKRDHSRLMLIRRGCAKAEHLLFRDLPDALPANTRLFRNDVSVLKARLHGQRFSGGAVECLLLNPGGDANCWWCMLKPGKKLKPDSVFLLPGGARARVLEKGDEGRALVQFILPEGLDVQAYASAQGEIPLPPYIVREHAGKDDEERYQTSYADPAHKGAVAAPTAGLHFTPELDARLRERGHELLPLTLNVGMGTFKPIQAERVEDHTMHSEAYRIPAPTLAALRDASRPRLAVGTTSLRSIEDCFRKGALPGPDGSFASEASLFVYPPALFHVEHMLTNFHLPRSTLLCLVSAFLCPGSSEGIRLLLEYYREAIAMEYRFFSYGDAMLIV